MHDCHACVVSAPKLKTTCMVGGHFLTVFNPLGVLHVKRIRFEYSLPRKAITKEDYLNNFDNEAEIR